MLRLAIRPKCISFQLLEQVSSSRRYSADVSRRRLWRWGAIGADESPEVSETPQIVPQGRGVTAIACGFGHSAFVVDGKLFTYGSNKNGKLGRQGAEEDQEPAPALVEAPDGHRPAVGQVALGGKHSAVITEGGILWTWGYGGSWWYGAGALGLGKRSDTPSAEMVMSFVQAGLEVQQVACGGVHTVVLDQEGQLWTTGHGHYGELGRGAMASRGDELDFAEVLYFKSSTDSVLNPGEEPKIRKVDAGANFCGALSQHGELWVWGRNDYGQLGMGKAVMGDPEFCMKYPFLIRELPIEGHGLRDFACGDHHVVAVTTAGAIYEWGGRKYFEPTSITLPSRYQEGLKGVFKVAAGDRCSFALTTDGRLYSWGDKSTGCLALGADCEEEVQRPTLVPPETFGNQRVLDIAVSKNRCLAITEEA